MVFYTAFVFCFKVAYFLVSIAGVLMLLLSSWVINDDKLIMTTDKSIVSLMFGRL